ncbi:MAG: endonuclease III [Treponema sp.]|jgi:endonuclease-3|nr:endonuclease III [Treponema sp.]
MSARKIAQAPVKKEAVKNAPAAQAAIEWEPVFNALQKWRANLPDPSVSTVAEQFKNDPWAILVSTIISLRTKDEVTLAAARALLEKAGDCKKLLALTEREIQKLIYPAGFYKTKAVNLKKIALLVLDKHEGRVPDDLDTLLGFPGVGRKTANLVIIEAYNKDGICVDTHVHRISNRTGWLCSKTPEETEMRLRQILPRKYWRPINPVLVLYGQHLCRPVSPFCSRCVLPSCRREGVTTFR